MKCGQLFPRFIQMFVICTNEGMPANICFVVRFTAPLAHIDAHLHVKFICIPSPTIFYTLLSHSLRSSYFLLLFIPIPFLIVWSNSPFSIQYSLWVPGYPPSRCGLILWYKCLRECSLAFTLSLYGYHLLRNIGSSVDPGGSNLNTTLPKL